jgi:hypothetical protein
MAPSVPAANRLDVGRICSLCRHDTGRTKTRARRQVQYVGGLKIGGQSRVRSGFEPSGSHCMPMGSQRRRSQRRRAQRKAMRKRMPWTVAALVASRMFQDAREQKPGCSGGLRSLREASRYALEAVDQVAGSGKGRAAAVTSLGNQVSLERVLGVLGLGVWVFGCVVLTLAPNETSTNKKKLRLALYTLLYFTTPNQPNHTPCDKYSCKCR